MSPAADEEILALGRQPLSVQQAHAEGMALTEPRPLASGLGSEFRKYLFRPWGASAALSQDTQKAAAGGLKSAAG